MITKSIYSYRVRIKYGVYTRTIIRGVFPPISLQPTICSLSVLSVLCSLSKPTGSGVQTWALNTLSGGFPLVQANAEAEIIARNQF